MSILIVAENSQGSFKKATKEAITYGADLAQSLGQNAAVLVLGNADNKQIESLSKHGVASILHNAEQSLDNFDAAQHTEAIHAAASNAGASTIIISNTYYGKAISGRLAVKFGAALASDAISMATPVDGGLRVRKSVFSNKGFAELNLKAAKRIIALSPNSYTVKESETSSTIESTTADLTAARTSVVERKMVEGKIPLTEAELVISGGRGLKGPENWHLIENLAQSLGAATACSKPVSDMDWRPHDEHVGQTGITIKPDLYVACGISGAIQHLAGVSSSKVIVVVNTDPEAPFFKIADYGIVGDAFEVLPLLKEAVDAFKANA